MGVFLIIGILAGVTAVSVAIDYTVNHMYIMSENIHAVFCGSSIPRTRRGSTSLSSSW
jgi:hypothetical protein